MIGGACLAGALLAAPPPPPAIALTGQELRRLPASEARQGVAVDSRAFYAIANTRIGRYDKRTGAKLAEWIGDGRRIAHLNSCTVDGAELVCANSDYPALPMASSVEFFDAATLRHLRSVPLGVRIGSLTWVERHGGFWWAGFAQYDPPIGEPGRDHRWTRVAKLDDQWREVGGYRFPDDVLDRFAPRSNSGGGWGADGLLYVTGHDRAELYVLREPGAGTTLEHVATIAVPFAGQAWAWDRSEPRTIYGIARAQGEVVTVRVPPVPLPPPAID